MNILTFVLAESGVPDAASWAQIIRDGGVAVAVIAILLWMLLSGYRRVCGPQEHRALAERLAALQAEIKVAERFAVLEGNMGSRMDALAGRLDHFEDDLRVEVDSRHALREEMNVIVGRLSARVDRLVEGGRRE